MNVEQRDIVLIPFPYSNLLISKKRPVLVLSDNNYNSKFKDIICCAITSNKKLFDEGVRIWNKDLDYGNLDYESVVKYSKTFTILKSKIIKKLGRLNIQKSKEVVEELNSIIKIKDES